MSIARYTLICSSKSAHREVRHSTNKRLIDCLGLHLESLFLFSTYKSVLEIKLQNAFLCLVPHARGRSHRSQNRRCHRRDNLHNPLKSLLLRHNRLLDFLPLN